MSVGGRRWEQPVRMKPTPRIKMATAFIIWAADRSSADVLAPLQVLLGGFWENVTKNLLYNLFPFADPEAPDGGGMFATDIGLEVVAVLANNLPQRFHGRVGIIVLR